MQNYNINIFDTEDLETFTGEFIKNWCEHHTKINSDYAYHASELYNKYFYKENQYKPSLKVYYIVDYYRKYNRPMVEAWLSMDEVKSPRKNK